MGQCYGENANRFGQGLGMFPSSLALKELSMKNHHKSEPNNANANQVRGATI